MVVFLGVDSSIVRFPQLNLHLYARPDRLESGPPLTVGDASLRTLLAPNLALGCMQVSFEQVLQRLEELPRLYIELDGSFVWTGQTELQAWQLDGMLYDYAQHLQRVELKGACPLESWQVLCAALGSPEQALVAHLLDHQRFVDAVELESLWG